MSCEVRLSTSEFCDAVDVAAARIRASARRGLRHANVRSRSLTARLSDDVLGACAELAVSRWLGIPWSRGVNTFHEEADVGEDVDVRCTRYEGGYLVVRQQDSPQYWMVFVTGTPPVMRLRGFIRTWEAQQPQFWRNGHGAFLVPQNALLEIPADGSVPVELRQTASAATT